MKDYVDDFQAANSTQHRGIPSQGWSTRWAAPFESWFKLNVGNATDASDGRKGVGAIVHDHRNGLKMDVAMPGPSLISIMAIELYALNVGL